MSTQTKIRMPVFVRVVDADAKEHEFGPVWVEVDQHQCNDHWRSLAEEEIEAAKNICADLSCAIDYDTLLQEAVKMKEQP